MNRSPRERLLITLFPAILVIVVYGLFLSRHARLQATRNELLGVRAKAATNVDVQAKQLELKRVEDELASYRTQQAELQQRWDRLVDQRYRTATKRHAGWAHLSSVLWQRGLQTYEEEPVTGDARVPASLEAALQKLTKGVVTPQNRLMKIQFQGRYADVLAALEAIANHDTLMIPVSIEMTADEPDAPWRLWTLLVWI